MRIAIALLSALAAAACSSAPARMPGVEFACETRACPLRFQGNAQVSSAELTAEVAGRPALPGELFRELVPVRVRAAYYDRGFVDARVTTHLEGAAGDGSAAGGEGGGQALVVAIDEGRPYWMCRLSVTDPAALPGEALGNPSALRAAIAEPEGAIFARRALIDEARGILGRYRETGYAWADADVAVRRDDGQHCVNVDIVVRRGPATVVDRVDVQGGEGLPPAAVQGRLSVRPGDAYRASAVQATSRALEEIAGASRKVEVSETPVAGHPERVIVSFGIHWADDARASPSPPG